MVAIFDSQFPGIKIGRRDVRHEEELRSDYGGMKVYCVYQGKGEVFLPAGYRTQEGDGQSLPDEYVSEPTDPSLVAILETIRTGRSTLTDAALLPTDAILLRLKGETFIGDLAGELWRLEEQAPRPWSSDPKIEDALEQLFLLYRDHGYSTKQTGSWEPIRPGDQLVTCGEETIGLRGEFSCFTIEKVDQKTTHVSTARRLRYLLDTAGGCSPGFDPFRRLPLTWFFNYDEEEQDGVNFFNNHVVNIPAENSPTHFHPMTPIGGGMAQTEMYLVLDPAEYNLSTAGLPCSITLFPNLHDLTVYEDYPLEPGMFVLIPPDTGHRGKNVFANIMTVPGFKPHNELYLDRDIHDRAGDVAPYNDVHLGSKNYDNLDDLMKLRPAATN